jgi:2-ketocyclohexanecarboxyl-CoA hydrolase
VTVSRSGAVRVEDRGHTRWLTLDNPGARNAYDQDMAVQIAEVMDDCNDVRTVVLTGSPGAFCAGGMLAGMSAPTQRGMRQLYRASLRLFDSIRNCPRPVIAAVNGAAAGGGNELVVACDLAIAGRSATFGQTGPRVGSAPVTGATNVMGIQIGEKRAKELALLCRRYSAEEALDLGLVNAVVDDDRLEAEAQSWCDELHQLSPRYLEITKVSSNIWWNQARDNFAQGVGMLVQAIGSPDMREGASAFLEKRPARFELDPGELPQDQH